ncbi:multidrug ABC transporter permease [Furfurilactobacillus entadae]|uniref:multidrug ABC transporter permease n=1 Tax=Furfurilactobacillus entadae TaxID=2922307 RepID=UPI0035E6F9A5
MRFLRLFWFHFKQYGSNQYFFWLPVTSTVSIFLLQYVVAYANDGLANPQLWINSGVVGLWASTATAAGSIGFQRFQGTLPYIVNTRYDERGSLIALLLPASSYGLLAFPLAYGLAKVTGVMVGSLSLNWLFWVICLWGGAALMGLLLAAFFTLTPNALVYESLIDVPIVLLTGLFGGKALTRPVMAVSQWLFPITAPISALTGNGHLHWDACIVSITLWVGLTAGITKHIMVLAKKKGTLKVI